MSLCHIGNYTRERERERGKRKKEWKSNPPATHHPPAKREWLRVAPSGRGRFTSTVVEIHPHRGVEIELHTFMGCSHT
jgi:hypothetical protein